MGWGRWKTGSGSLGVYERRLEASDVYSSEAFVVGDALYSAVTANHTT